MVPFANHWLVLYVKVMGCQGHISVHTQSPGDTVWGDGAFAPHLRGLVFHVKAMGCQGHGMSRSYLSTHTLTWWYCLRRWCICSSLTSVLCQGHGMSMSWYVNQGHISVHTHSPGDTVWGYGAFAHHWLVFYVKVMGCQGHISVHTHSPGDTVWGDGAFAPPLRWLVFWWRVFYRETLTSWHHYDPGNLYQTEASLTSSEMQNKTWIIQMSILNLLLCNFL